MGKNKVLKLMRNRISNPTVDKKPNILITLIFAIITVLYSGHATFTFFTSMKYIIVLSFLLALPALYLFYFRKKEFNDGLIVYLLTVVMLICTTFASGFEGIVTYVLLGCLVTTALAITLTYSFSSFVNAFLNTMVVVAFIGIAGHLLVVNTDVEELFPVFLNNNEVEYKSIFIFSTIAKIPDRNCGMFWEPGLFATFLLYAIVFELVFKKKSPSILRLLLFAVGIITTTSAAGYALLLMCALLFFSILFHKNKNKTVKIIFLCCIAAVILFIVSLNFIITNTSLADNPYLSKLLLENILESSRVKAILHNFDVFAEFPLFGAGLQRALDATKHVSDTSTSTYMLSVFGILGGLYTFWWIIGVVKIKGMSVMSKAILLIILLCIVNKEPHMFILFSWIVMFYLIQGKPGKELEIRRTFNNR